MKKLTLSIGLVAAILSAKAQDTTCTWFKGKNIVEFNYQTSKVKFIDEQSSRYHDITVKYGDVLCLDLSDKRKRVRKVIITFFDGNSTTEILNSKDKIYFSPQGAVKVSVGKPKFKL